MDWKRYGEDILSKGDSDQPEQIMRRQFYSYLYLFDLADDGRIVAERCPMLHSCGGKRLSDLTDEETVSLIFDYLREYNSRPMVVGLDGEIGLILPYATPSASLGILLIPTLPRRVLLRALRRLGEEALVWQESLWEESGRYRSAPDEGTQRAMDSLLWEIGCCARIGEEKESLHTRIHSLSHVVGCPVTVSISDSEEWESGLDRGLCDAFLLVILLLCRRISSYRTATVFRCETPAGKGICVKLPDPDGRELTGETVEIAFLQSLADRKRIPFDHTASDLFLTLNFSPIHPDWSYLGIKQPENEFSEKKEMPRNDG